jgi:hypothetical protein
MKLLSSRQCDRPNLSGSFLRIFSRNLPVSQSHQQNALKTARLKNFVPNQRFSILGAKGKPVDNQGVTPAQKSGVFAKVLTR